MDSASRPGCQRRGVSGCERGLPSLSRAFSSPACGETGATATTVISALGVEVRRAENLNSSVYDAPSLVLALWPELRRLRGLSLQRLWDSSVKPLAESSARASSTDPCRNSATSG